MSSNRKSSPLYISRIRSASGGGGATGGVEAILISTPCLSGLLGVGLIRLTTAADFAAIEAAKNDLAKFCPVAKVIRGSGTQVVEEWHLSRPTA